MPFPGLYHPLIQEDDFQDCFFRSLKVHKNLLRIWLRGSEPAGLGWAWAAAALTIGNHLQSPTARFSKVPRASESKLQRSCTVFRCGIPKNAMSTGCLPPLRIDFSKQGLKLPLHLRQTKPKTMRGLNTPQSLSFSLGTLGARVQTDLLVSSGCALPKHLPTRRPQLREKQAISKRVHNKKPENKRCILKSALFSFFSWLGFFLLLLKVPQPDLLVSFKWQVLCTH